MVLGLVRRDRIRLPGYGEARFDLAIPELCWAIEVDLNPTHCETIGIALDAHRNDVAAAIGWSTTHITKAHHARRTNETIAEISTLHTQLRLRSAC